jgi:hypothetical protein
MEIARDYLANVKLPIIAIIALFFIQAVLILVLTHFTDLGKDQLVNTWVLGGINFAFTICIWLIVAWAGLRTVKKIQGIPIDGAIAGAITAVVAMFIIRVIELLFKINALPFLVDYSPSGSTAAGILSVLGIFLGVVGIIIGIVIDLLFGAALGFLGATVHRVNPSLLSAYSAAEAKLVGAGVVKKNKKQ